MTLDSVSRNAVPARRVGNHLLLSGSPMYQRSHICAFFSSADDEYEALLPFIKEGLDCGEKAVHVVDPQRSKDHADRLTAAGIDIAALQQSGQLELGDWMTAHMRDGRFDVERTLQHWGNISREAREGGFPAVRFVSHMQWAADPSISLIDLLTYEANANLAWPDNGERPNPVICTYDLTKFRAEVVIEVMRTHPLVVIGGLLQENPFFVPPDEYLQDLYARHSDHERVQG